MVNPMSMMTPEQLKMVAQIQEHTNSIKALVVRHKGVITITLSTQSEEAKEYIPQVQEALIKSIAQSLQVLFGITGTIEE